jgi:hypothetical protein
MVEWASTSLNSAFSRKPLSNRLLVHSFISIQAKMGGGGKIPYVLNSTVMR